MINNIIKIVIYRLICFIDSFFWLIIMKLNAKFLFKLFAKRPWLIFSIQKKNIFLYKLIELIKKLILKRCNLNPSFSTCLSRSITARFVLDIFDIKNELYLGMTKNKEGKKVPHAWLVQEGIEITPKMANELEVISLHKL